MKRLPALILFLIAFTACKKNKPQPPTVANNKIAGQWHIQTVTVIPRDSTGNIMNPGTTYPEPSYYYFNFKTDGTWGEVLTPDIQSDIADGGNYVLHGDTSFSLIYVNAPAQPVEYKIVSISDTSFVFTHQKATLYNGVTRGYLEYVFKLRK